MTELQEKCMYLYSLVNDCLVDLTDEGFTIDTKFEYKSDEDIFLIITIRDILPSDIKKIMESIDDMTSHLTGEGVRLISNEFSNRLSLKNMELMFRL